ncbi:DNA mismatch repair protein MLH3, partial [Tanacetum coccineum]
TSKFEQLLGINTVPKSFGFHGEPLSSIFNVSPLEGFTKARRLPNATSKFEQLPGINTVPESFGFHGEPLSSIFNVSPLEVFTKARGLPNGYCKMIEEKIKNINGVRLRGLEKRKERKECLQEKMNRGYVVENVLIRYGGSLVGNKGNIRFEDEDEEDKDKD